MARLGAAFVASILLALVACWPARSAQGPGPPPPVEALPADQDAEKVGLVPDLALGPHLIDPDAMPVGFIDSGVQVDHPQLLGVVREVRDFTGEGPQDDLGHGTMAVLVLTRAAFSEDMVAASKILGRPPQAHPVIMAKVVGRRLVPLQVTADRMVQAIAWLKSLGVQVVNISLAMPQGAADYKALCEAIAAASDIMFSIAAGNAGPNAVVYPAACGTQNAIIVGVVGADGVVPGYSGRADVVAPVPPAPIPLYEFHRRQADRLVGQRKFAEAKQAYLNAAAAQPPPPAGALIEYGLGFVALQNEDRDAARGHFEAAARLSPGYAESMSHSACF